MKPQVIFWGASGHALVVADIIRLCGEYDIVGFLDDVSVEGTLGELCGFPVFSGIENLDRLYREGVRHVIIAFGNCVGRLKAAEIVRSRGFQLATAVHPTAIIASDVVVGEGTVIAAGAVVNPAVRIGANVIVNTAASVDHESELANGVHICPGVRLAGQVKVGEGALVGIGSSVIERVSIGAGAFIGAGSVVIDDIPPYTLAYGVPAKVKKRIEP
jgi:sugar O-acyltransferase (sialic acid O-acetyltransferase NeuD family)